MYEYFFLALLSIVHHCLLRRLSVPFPRPCSASTFFFALRSFSPLTFFSSRLSSLLSLGVPHSRFLLCAFLLQSFLLRSLPFALRSFSPCEPWFFIALFVVVAQCSSLMVLTLCVFASNIFSTFSSSHPVYA